MSQYTFNFILLPTVWSDYITRGGILELLIDVVTCTHRSPLYCIYYWGVCVFCFTTTVTYSLCSTDNMTIRQCKCNWPPVDFMSIEYRSRESLIGTEI